RVDAVVPPGERRRERASAGIRVTRRRTFAQCGRLDREYRRRPRRRAPHQQHDAHDASHIPYPIACMISRSAAPAPLRTRCVTTRETSVSLGLISTVTFPCRAACTTGPAMYGNTLVVPIDTTTSNP